LCPTSGRGLLRSVQCRGPPPRLFPYTTLFRSSRELPRRRRGAPGRTTPDAPLRASDTSRRRGFSRKGRSQPHGGQRRQGEPEAAVLRLDRVRIADVAAAVPGGVRVEDLLPGDHVVAGLKRVVVPDHGGEV